MTLDEIRRFDRDYLTPAQVAGVLGCDPQGIRIWAKQKPNELGFPICVIGTRVKIPRKPFLKFMTGGIEAK